MACQIEEQDDNELRILLIGRTGSGKSSLGNSILGYKDTDEGAFTVSGRSTSCTSDSEMKEKEDHHGYLVTVVDTPGLYDTAREEKEIESELTRILAITTPGFHVILFVMKKERYTDELKETQDKFFEWFGEGVEKHALIVVTGISNEAEMKEYKSEPDPKFSEFIERCNGRILGVDNKSVEHKKSQLKKLFTEMSQIKRANKHFSNPKYNIARMYAISETLQEFKRKSKRYLSKLVQVENDDKANKPSLREKGILDRNITPQLNTTTEVSIIATTKEIPLLTTASEFSQMSISKEISKPTITKEIFPVTTAKEISPMIKTKISQLNTAKEISPMIKTKISQLNTAKEISQMSTVKKISPVSTTKEIFPVTTAKEISPMIKTKISQLNTAKEVSPMTTTKEISPMIKTKMSQLTTAKDVSTMTTTKQFGSMTTTKEIYPTASTKDDLPVSTTKEKFPNDNNQRDLPSDNI